MCRPRTIACMLALLCAFAVTTEAISSVKATAGRELLQKKLSEDELLAEELEREREQEALDDFREFQAQRNAEKERLIIAAQDEAEEVVVKFNRLKNSGGKKRFLKTLWKNGKGLVISHFLKFFIDGGDGETVIPVILKSMREAEEEGFGITVAEAVSSALTVVLEDGDADHFVDLLVMRLEELEKEEKGSGCQYIKFMLLDAETFAISNSREIDFTRAIDGPQHLGIAECFFDECTETAVKCCTDKTAEASGLCGCGKGKESRICEFNLFSSQPRAIWLCNTAECEEFEKCLCPSKKKLRKIRQALKAEKQAEKKERGKGKGTKSNKGKKNKNKKNKKKVNKNKKDNKKAF